MSNEAAEGLRQRIATTSESLDTPEDFSADDSGIVWDEEPETWAARNDRLRSAAKQRQHTNKEYIQRKRKEQDGTWLSLCPILSLFLMFGVMIPGIVNPRFHVMDRWIEWMEQGY